MIDRAGRLTLVLGGARSGKSRYAEALALSIAERPHYVATAEILDPGMAARVADHRARRTGVWQVSEEPLYLSALLLSMAAGDVVLVDCLTVWLGNLMVNGHDVPADCAALVDAVASTPARLILVANEVCLAPLPDNAMAREFARHAARLNRDLAERADTVRWLMAGRPIDLKPGV